MMHLDDHEKLRTQDVPYTELVMDYVRSKGLAVRLGGSAAEGNIDYNDVDILAIGLNKDVLKAVRGLERLVKTKPLPKKTNDGVSIRVDRVGQNEKYLNDNVDHRYNIKIGSTDIDLCLKCVTLDNALEVYASKMLEQKMTRAGGNE
ncbi:hypothetical protein GOV06_03315 [Candidatus Woesearchaeota archaeon]|nr:hypothetical protein [Candidatus Woesearchaeota archaeon]